MNLCLFLEGTGRGVAGKITNVTRLRNLCVDDARYFCCEWLRQKGDGRSLEFFRPYAAKEVVLECPWTSEESCFRFAHCHAGVELERNQGKRANEVCKLEKPVLGWTDVLREIDCARERVLKYIMKDVCDCGLSAIVVDFHAIKPFKRCLVRGHKICECSLEPCSELDWAGYIVLVNENAFVLEIYLSGKSHHSGEDAFAQTTVQELISLFSANERPRMENECLCVNSDFVDCSVHFCQLRRDVDGLVVKHHADDIKARAVVWVEETARLVYEHAQFASFHLAYNRLFNRKWRKFLPATFAEAFPRIQVVPAFRPSPRRSIPNYYSWCKGAWVQNFAKAS